MRRHDELLPAQIVRDLWKVRAHGRNHDVRIVLCIACGDLVGICARREDGGDLVVVYLTEGIRGRAFEELRRGSFAVRECQSWMLARYCSLVVWLTYKIDMERPYFRVGDGSSAGAANTIATQQNNAWKMKIDILESTHESLKL